MNNVLTLSSVAGVTLPDLLCFPYKLDEKNGAK